jgi:TPR repeat protein
MSGDHVKAFNLWQTAAQKGNAEAQFNLAFMYENAQGTQRDLFAAAKWYELAAGQNYPMSESMLQVVQRKIHEEIQKALLEWLPKAEAGDAKSQLTVSQILSTGKRATEDNIEALKWLLLAEEGAKNQSVKTRITRFKKQLILKLKDAEITNAKSRVLVWKDLRKPIE